MIVKVCGIARREDAQAAFDAGASAIGFIFYPKSPRYIKPERAAEIGEGLKVWKVGIFVDERASAIERIASRAQLDIAQIYEPKYLRREDGVSRLDLPGGTRVWRAQRVATPPPGLHHLLRIIPESLLESGIEAVLFDGLKNGAKFDWAIARSSKCKVLVAGGLDASNVAEAIRTARPWGVDASSKLETSPGIKDHAKVRAFVTAALKAGKEVGLDLAAR